jgi:hypothetical protein
MKLFNTIRPMISSQLNTCCQPKAYNKSNCRLREESVWRCFQISFSPLSRAEHRRGGQDKRADLFERSAFPRPPTDVATRRVKRGAGGFFWFVFFSEKENEQIK